MFYSKNRVKCLICEDIVSSVDVDKWEECTCGNVNIRGGSSFLERKIQDVTASKDMSIIEFPENFQCNDEVTKQPPPPLPPGFLRSK